MPSVSSITERGAILQNDYRYTLWRIWNEVQERLTFIMLNKSVADSQHDDRTISRCINFAQRGSYGSLEVVNCFALRTPQPTLLRTHPDPIGPDNRIFLLQAAERASCIVAAWGSRVGSSIGIWRCSCSWPPIPCRVWD